MPVAGVMGALTNRLCQATVLPTPVAGVAGSTSDGGTVDAAGAGSHRKSRPRRARGMLDVACGVGAAPGGGWRCGGVGTSGISLEFRPLHRRHLPHRFQPLPVPPNRHLRRPRSATHPRLLRHRPPLPRSAAQRRLPRPRQPRSRRRASPPSPRWLPAVRSVEANRAVGEGVYSPSRRTITPIQLPWRRAKPSIFP